MWVPGCEGIVGNETADRLAKLGSKCPFIGPEPANSIPVEVAKKAVRNWTNRDHRKHWESLTGLIQGPSARRTKELLKLNRNQLRWVTGLLTGCYYLKDTFSKWD
jgi:hypothetical protein